MMAGQSIYEVRNSLKKCEEALLATYKVVDNLEKDKRALKEEYDALADTCTKTIHELKQRIGEMTRDRREEVRGLEHRITLKDGKIRNFVRLVEVHKKRLSRMGDRLTGLAAERNTLYSELVGARRELDRVQATMEAMCRDCELVEI